MSFLKPLASAALFAAATRVGAIVAGRPKAEADALEAYGRNFGISATPYRDPVVAAPPGLRR